MSSVTPVLNQRVIVFDVFIKVIRTQIQSSRHLSQTLSIEDPVNFFLDKTTRFRAAASERPGTIWVEGFRSLQSLLSLFSLRICLRSRLRTAFLSNTLLMLRAFQRLKGFVHRGSRLFLYN